VAPSVVIAGGVAVNERVVLALVEAGVKVSLLIGYGNRMMGAAGYYPVTETNAKLGFRYPVVCVNDINDPFVVESVRRYGGDLLLVTGWSQIFKRALRGLFPLGCVGLHPTLLPQGRGRAPIPWTILKGLERSGVTLFHLGDGADDGDIVGQEGFEVAADETATTLYEKVCVASAKLCVEMVPRLLMGCAPRTPQVGTPSVWPKRTPEDGELSWGDPPSKVGLYCRALADPYPPPWFRLGDKRVYLRCGDA
jgi:methionyl-tRNA formyltransferase